MAPPAVAPSSPEKPIQSREAVIEAVMEARKVCRGNELVKGKMLVSKGSCTENPIVKMNDKRPTMTNVVRKILFITFPFFIHSFFCNKSAFFLFLPIDITCTGIDNGLAPVPIG